MLTSRTHNSSKKQTNVPAPVLEMGRAISDQVMQGNLDFDNVANKSAHVKVSDLDFVVDRVVCV